MSSHNLWKHLGTKGTGLLLVALAVVAAVLEPQGADARPLGAAEIRVLGIRVDLDTRPDVEGLQATMTAVKDVPAAVQSFVGLPGVDARPNLAPGVVVKAALSGPGFFEGPVTLSAVPNGPMELPVLRVAGDYLLHNVRLEDEKGRLILTRDGALSPVVISVIDELLVTQVTSRPLSLEEIQDLGIVVDEDNFTVMNFTVGLTLGSERVTIDLPVALPTSFEKLETPAIALPEVQRRLDRIAIPNFTLVGFQLRKPDLPEEVTLELPPINGVIVIPGNIAFLNQFFSVFLQTSNLAPQGSGLVLENARAFMHLPPGKDAILGTGDDPLRAAETQGGVVAEDLPLINADGADAVVPQGTSQAEFLVEGLREGTHTVTFDVTGDLYVPSLGSTVPMTGKAAGLVQVKNPTFSLVLAHPSVVREEEPYTIVATVTNTSLSPANLFQIRLDTRSLSGARLAEGEQELKSLESLAPGESGSFSFRLVARTTGKVTGTVQLADEGINGSFLLTTGVGDTGIPLSPDALVLPSTVEYLPHDPDLAFAATRLLGQAYSLATAPGGSLPADRVRVTRSFVLDRAVKLAQAGLHVRFGQTQTAAAQDVLMDFFGADRARLDTLYANDPEARTLVLEDLDAFDGLRRTCGAGLCLSQVLGTLLGRALEERTLALFQQQWAETFASRPAHLSFGASAPGSAVLLRVTDGEQRELGSLDPGAAFAREVPFGDRLVLSDTHELLFIAAPTSDSYLFEWACPEPSDLELSLVVPGTSGMVLVTYAAPAIPAGARGRMFWTRDGPNDFVFSVDTDGDGVADATLSPEPVQQVADLPPAVLGVHQWGKGTEPRTNSFEVGDALGFLVGVLFDEEVTGGSATDPTHFEAPDIGVGRIAFQPDRRMVFMSLKKPVGPFVPRELVVQGIADIRGNVMGSATHPIVPDPELGPGGTFSGRVVTAQGSPVSFASVRYIQPVWVWDSLLKTYEVEDLEVAACSTDAYGSFSLDYVLANTIWDSGSTKHTQFTLKAADPQSGQQARVSSRIAFNGQRMGFDLIIRGHGSVQGLVYDETGARVVGGDPGTPGFLAVTARNINTGEVFHSWVDADGRYAFPRQFEGPGGTRIEAPGVAAGTVILHIVREAGGATAVATVSVSGQGVEVTRDLVLVVSSATVAGRVVEADGETGAPSVRVQIKGRVLEREPLGTWTFSTAVVGAAQTDAQGHFDFGPVPAGDIQVTAFRASTFEKTVVSSSVTVGGRQDLLLILPGSGAVVRGVVQDALGSPVPGAQVTSGLSLTETDTYGAFTFEGLPVGPFRICAKGPSSLAMGCVTGRTFSAQDVQEVLVRLEPVGTIVGTVYEADGFTPVVSQKVQLWTHTGRSDDGVLATVLTDLEGAYRFDNYPVGDYSVRAVRQDYGDGGMAYATIRTSGDFRHVDITFRGLGQIRGRVIQDDGTPVVCDLVITRKVWRVVVSESRQNNVYLEYVERLGEIDEISADVEKSLAEVGFSLEPPEFFLLVSEPVHLRSDVPGPSGEVTGTFHFQGPALAGPFEVAAFGPFLAPAQVSGEIPRTTDPAVRVVDAGDIVLEPAVGSVEGTVFMPDGRTPVGAGVLVTIRSLDGSGTIELPGGVSQPVLPAYDVLTDGQGHFSFPLVLRGRFILSADTGEPDPAIKAHSGPESRTDLFEDGEGNRVLNVRLYGETSGVVPTDQTLTAPIRLRDVAGIDVRVYENDGVSPAPYARVTVSGFEAPANADADGMVHFFPLQEGGFSVSAGDQWQLATGSTSGQVPQDPPNGYGMAVRVVLGAVTTPQGEVLDSEFFGTVTGTIYRPDGTVVENPAQVTVRCAGIRIVTTSDGSGHYQAENVPGGAFTVEAVEPLTARTGAAVGFLEAGSPVEDVPVTLAGLGTVTGQVLGSEGSVIVSPVDIVLTPIEGRDLLARTDAQGIYCLPGVPLGSYRVKATDTVNGLVGEARGELLHDGDTETTDVVLEPAGRIMGTVYGPGVLLDQEGNPVGAHGEVLDNAPVEPYAQVTIARVSFTQSVTADGAGAYTCSHLLSLGTYTVTARLAGSGRQDGAAVTATLSHGGQDVRACLSMNGNGTVEGLVVPSDGQTPVPTAQVTLTSASPFSDGPVMGLTDGDGAFSFTGVPVGAFSLSVRSGDLGASVEGALQDHGQALVFRDDDDDPDHGAIRLEDVAAVQGRVLQADGSTAAAGAVVEIAGGGMRRVRLCDAGGFFVCTELPMGTYEVSILEPGTGGIAGRTVMLDTNGQVVDLGSIVLDSAPPVVVSTVPGADAGGVSPQTTVTVTFSEPVDPRSIHGQTFRVLVDGAAAPGVYQVLPSQTQAVFTLGAPLPHTKRVTVVLKGEKLGFEGQVLDPGIRDLAGHGMVADHTFAFTTADTAPPRLLRFTPAAGQKNVSLETVVRVEFSEPVDPGSIAAFALEADGVPVAGGMNTQPILGDRVFVFTPQALLEADTTYTATVTGPVRDLLGNAMAVPSLSTVFSTIDTKAPVITSLEVVGGVDLVFGKTVQVAAALEAPEDGDSVEFYVNGVLSRTVAQAPFVFGLLLDEALGAQPQISAVAVDSAGNRSERVYLTLSISANQPPQVVLASPAGGTVSLGQAVLVQVSATDDVGVNRVAYTASGGMTASGAREIPSSPSALEVFSFTVPMDFPVGASIVVRGAATDSLGLVSHSEEVTLTVQDLLPPQVTIGSPAHLSTFDPGAQVQLFVAAQDTSGIQSITLTVTGALDLSDSRVFSPAVSPASGAFVLTVPQTALPTESIWVTATATDTAGNSRNKVIRLNITDLIPPSASLASASGLLLAEPGKPAVVMVSAADTVGVSKVRIEVTGIHSETREFAAQVETAQVFSIPVPPELALGSQIMVHATVWDAAGNTASAADLVLTAADLTPPAVTVTSPVTGSEAIPGQVLEIRVSATDTYGVALLSHVASGAALGTGEQAVTPPAPAAEAVFSLAVPAMAPAGSLIAVEAGAVDSAGNATTAPLVTVRVADIMPPEVTDVSPADGTVHVSPETVVTVTFSEPVDTETVGAETMVLTGPGEAVVPGTYAFSEANRVVTFTPAQALGWGLSYTLTLTPDIHDVAGNALAADVTASFVTVPPDTVPPTVTGVSPANGAMNQPVNTVVVLTFSEPLNPATVNTGSVRLTGGTGPVSGNIAISQGNTVVSFYPSSSLQLGTAYTVTVTTAVTDAAGNALVVPFISAFLTVTPDTTPPQVVWIVPLDGEQGVVASPIVEVAFSEPIDPATVSSITFLVSPLGAEPAAGTYTATEGNTRVEWTAELALMVGETYEVVLTDGITDAAGNGLVPFAATFTVSDFALITPRQGDLVVEGQTIGIEAGATNTPGITEVVFSVNGVDVGTASSAPYAVLYTAPTVAEAGGTGLAITARGVTPVGVIAAGGIIVTLLPADGDADGDGITNGQEIAAGTDPLTPDADQDTDGDGLTNALEVLLGTSVHHPDTDADGLTDGQEDANHNGFRDAGETDPLSADTDLDGMEDGEEVQWGLDPLTDDAQADPDGDGIVNRDEIRLKANPFSFNPPLFARPDTVLSGRNVYSSIMILPGYTVRVSGSEPLELVSATNIVIAGTIDVSGGDGQAAANTTMVPAAGGLGVAGGGDGGSGGVMGDGSPGWGFGGGGGGKSPVAHPMCSVGGGGGGGYGGAGTTGFYTGPAECMGTGGLSYGTASVEPLHAGSGGGGGGSGASGFIPGGTLASNGGGGGAGGGAVYLEALGQILIDVTGVIDADGGTGGMGVSGSFPYAGSGGGGSGGAIYLKAPHIENSGSVHAVGGVGGVAVMFDFSPGGAGGAGRIRVDAGVLTVGGGPVSQGDFAATTNPPVGRFGGP